jgi:uncharacterized membrane protein YdfJ with MMPL/SSD domain
VGITPIVPLGHRAGDRVMPKAYVADYGTISPLFLTFALSGPLPPKEMGIILGVTVLLDAALIRLLLVPVMLRLLGRWAWWLPKPLDRLLPDVRFGHA